MVLAATCQAAQLRKRTVREAGCPPVVLMRKREKRAVVLRFVSQVKAFKEIGYGEQQAGAEHPGFLSQHGA
jgi:hypothetical protein